MAKKALLMILDGWGIGKHGKGDVIFNTPTPYLDLLTATSAHSQLQASMDYRIQRVMRRQNVTEQEARDIIAKLDASREAYIKKYEDTSRYDTRNYHLVISMDNLNEDDAVEVIMDYINRMSL